MPELAGIDCQLWDLQQLRPSSPMLQTPLPDGWSENVEEQEPCSDPFDQWRRTGVGESHLDALSKKIRYYRRALERMGDVVVEAPAPDTLDDLLTAFFDLHTARWKRAICRASSPTKRRRLSSRGGAANARSRPVRMYATRVAAASSLSSTGFALHGTVYYYLSGYDPIWKN